MEEVKNKTEKVKRKQVKTNSKTGTEQVTEGTKTATDEYVEDSSDEEVVQCSR